MTRSYLLLKPLDMVLYCPKCGHQHIDKPDTEADYTVRLHESSWWELGGDKPERWTNPPHRSHLCAHCGTVWRPADAYTNGVAEITTRGGRDTWPFPTATDHEPPATDRYAYSTDSETFYGGFASRDDARAAAVETLIGDAEPGETRVVWTAVCRPAVFFLSRCATRIGENFLEHVNDWLTDYIAWNDDVARIDDKEAFGVELLALLQRFATFHAWHAGDVQEHKEVVPVLDGGA